MNYLDVKYINLISPQLIKFAKKKEDLYTFRCPYCGDSVRNRNKTRGYFYRKRNDYFFKCHNCGVGRTFTNFLKDNDVLLHDEYVMERYKEGLTGKASNTPEPKFDIKSPNFDKSIFSNLQKISNLNNNHLAWLYLSNRKIPEKHFSNFYYAEDYNAWSKTNNPTKESRIIIPLLKEDGNVFGYQARSLNKNTKLRYITTIIEKGYPKVFGVERVKKSQTVYVTEGPFDSLFLSNSIAMCGSDVSLKSFDFRDVVYVLDNEPRNPQIVEKYDKLINSGEKVVIYPRTVKEKDLNDMAMAGLDVQDMVECNIYQGLEAKVKFIDWKQV
jgi:hypothetical protein